MNYGPPITASPVRIRADPAKLSYIRTWIKDFPDESISNDADAITEKLKELSFTSHASLYHLDDSFLQCCTREQRHQPDTCQNARS